MRKKWIQPVPSNYTKELTVPAASKKKKEKIIKDLSQVRHFWFELLPSGRCFRAIKTQTKRFKNILYSKVMTALKTAGNSAFLGECIVPWFPAECENVSVCSMMSFAFLFRISVRIFVCFLYFCVLCNFLYFYIYIFFDIFGRLCRGLHRILSNAVVIHCIVYLQSVWVRPPGN